MIIIQLFLVYVITDGYVTLLYVTALVGGNYCDKRVLLLMKKRMISSTV